MFGAHKKKAREAGLAVRNSLATASMNTSNFHWGEGFQPSATFFLEPYVLGYCGSLLRLFQDFILKGKNWSQKKVGEYMIEAFHEIQRDTTPNDISLLMDEMIRLRDTSDYNQGMRDAELNFFTMFGMINKDVKGRCCITLA